MKNFYGYFYVVLISFFCISCVGDGAARIKGKISHNKLIEGKDCYLEVYLEKGDRLIQKMEIGNDFNEALTISPSYQNYYVIVRCEGIKKIYRKCCFSMGGSKYMKNPIDLGTISFENEKEK